MRPTPLFGRFDYPGIPALLTRLNRLGNLEFSAYLVTRDNQKFYGLSLAELQACERQYRPVLAAFSLSGQGPGDVVLRISLRFQGPMGHASGQYLISTGSFSRNHYWQQLLLGHEPVAPEPEETASPVKAETERSLPFIPQPPHRPKPSPPYRPRAFQQPTLSLTDHFYFDRNSSPDALITLLNRLSDTFLGGAPFHLRLETSDGDFHLKVDRQELQYLFSYRREKLLMLYMDAGSLDGQWINLRLSYHPLAMGPNAEVDLTSPQPDDVLAVVYDMIGTEPPASQWPARLNETYAFSPAGFDLPRLIELIEALSRHYLHRVPAVAFLASRSGGSYTGLSLYQLAQLYPRYQAQLEVLSIGVTQVSTGQNLSLMFRFAADESPATASLSMMWGDERKHEAVRALLVEQLALRPVDKGSQAPLPVDSSPQPTRLLCLVSLTESAEGEKELWEAIMAGARKAGGEVVRLQPARIHQKWEQEMQAMHAASVLVADLRVQEAEVMYRIGMARALGKRVILLTLDPATIPPPFRALSYLRLGEKGASPEAWSRELSQILRS